VLVIIVAVFIVCETPELVHTLVRERLSPVPLAFVLNLKKGNGSPYSITERRVPELIPVLGSQPAGDLNHKPDGRLPLLT